MIRGAGVVAASVLLTGCAAMAANRLHLLQGQLRCGMTSGQVEVITGERLQPVEKDTRLTHLYRSGMADLWLVFNEGRLRSSQVIRVKGLTGTEDEAIVNHCR